MKELKELTPQEVDELKKERRALRNEVKRLRKELNRWEKFYFVIQTASLSIERR
jgi:FtsZ-binding cell division protein ZapB